MKLVVLHVTCYIRSFRGRAREVAAPSFSYINERGVVDNIVGIASQVICRVWVSGKTGVTMVPGLTVAHGGSARLCGAGAAARSPVFTGTVARIGRTLAIRLTAPAAQLH